MPNLPETHRPKGWRSDAQRKAEYDARRGTAAQRGYGSRWQKARAAFLNQNPLCKLCERDGVIAAATDVDHITPHRGDRKLFWDRKNWQGLCETCHSRKTATEDSGFARRSERAGGGSKV